MAPFLDVVERKVGVAQALAEGQCGGSYSDACILISGMVSGIAADLWPGEGIDRKRLVEVWARYADPALSPLLISTPLLLEFLRRDHRVQEAEAIEALRPEAFCPGYQSRVVTSADVDMPEPEVLSVCPQLAPRLVRAYSYPAVFYQHVRSALVHEYHLGDAASTWPMTESEASVSYANVIDWKNPSRQYRQIHYHIPWLLKVVRSIASSTQTVLESAPLPYPSPWWVEGYMGNRANMTRYNRAVQRVTAEAFWLFTEQTALRALNSVTSRGLDFFRVAFTGLLGDRLLRLVRVFEQDPQVASFWYLFRCNQKGAEEAITRASGSMKQLEEFSARLKRIRDKTFVHIDKQAVFDPEQIYEQAGISHSDVDKAIRLLWGTMQALYRVTFGKAIEHDVYSGDDVVALARLRDASSSS